MAPSEQDIALLLGDIADDGVKAVIKSRDKRWIHKVLLSSPRNWETICELVEDPCVKVVVAKFTEGALLRCCIPVYREVVERLVGALAKTSHLVLVYKENLNGVFTYTAEDSPLALHDEDRTQLTDFAESYGYSATAEEMHAALAEVLSLCRKNGLNLAPYLTRAQALLSAQAFIEASDSGLLLRLYMPNGRIWEHELDKLVVLFREYLQKVAGKSVSLDQSKTKYGTTYTFYSRNHDLSPADFSTMFSQFTAFLEVCAHDPEQARQILADAHLARADLDDLVNRYAREARRLSIDMQYERRRKLLEIQHRMHSELADTLPPKEIDALLGQVTLKDDVHCLPTLPTGTGLSADHRGSTIINIERQVIQKVNNLIAGTLAGNVEYSNEERELLQLVEKHSANETEKASLGSAIHEMKDPDLSHATRTTAWQKVQGFLSRVTAEVGGRGLDLLQKWAEHKLTNSS